jgi:hypothetical protein
MNSELDAIFQFKLEVPNLRRPAWRRFQVPSTQTFWDLHCTIQNLLGFGFDTEFTFHVHDAKGQLKTLGIAEDVGYFAPSPQVAWLFRIADYLSPDGNRRMRYLHNAVFAPWVCSIELESVLPSEAAVRYPRCIAGERSVYESRGGMLGFVEHVEAGKGLPKGFDPEFFDPAGVQFDDSREEQMWTTFLDATLVPELLLNAFTRAHNGTDSEDRYLVLMPAAYYDLLLKQKFPVPPRATEGEHNPAEALNLVPIAFSKVSLHKLVEAVEARKSRAGDRVTKRRLALISRYTEYLDKGLARYRRLPKGSPNEQPRASGQMRRRSKWDAVRGTPGFIPPDPACPITLAAGLWRVAEKYQPVIICRQKESGGDRFVAVKMPVVERDQPINAALIAQLDLLQAAAELEPPETDMAARLFAIRIGINHSVHRHAGRGARRRGASFRK